jgi:hypothetical protein
MQNLVYFRPKKRGHAKSRIFQVQREHIGGISGPKKEVMQNPVYFRSKGSIMEVFFRDL